MAIRSTIQCQTCGEQKEVWHPASEAAPDTCADCKARELEKAKYLYMVELGKLGLEERVQRIESYIYDKQHGRDSGGIF